MFDGRPHTVFTIQHFVRCNVIVVGGGYNLQSLTNVSSLRTIQIDRHRCTGRR